MSQVLRNFLSNALKFTPEGGSVTVTVRTEGCSLRVEVEDSGAGISSENIRRLFVEVVQFNANTLQGGGGTGLGLWICKKIIDMHGGVIGASSEGEGKGSVFFFAIPLKQTTPNADCGESCRPVSNVKVSNGSCGANIRHDQFASARVDSLKSRMNFEMKRFLNYSESKHSGCRSFKLGDQINFDAENGQSQSEKIGSSFQAQLKIFPDPSGNCHEDKKTNYAKGDIPLQSVLLVDDSSLIRKMMTMSLQKDGFSVVESADGDEAVKIVQDSISDGASRFDIVVIDNVSILRCTSSFAKCIRECQK